MVPPIIATQMTMYQENVVQLHPLILAPDMSALAPTSQGVFVVNGYLEGFR